jgi:hypothetical protein
MVDQKPKFRDHLDVFAQEHYGIPTSRMSDTQRTEALTLAYLMSIRNVLLPGSVPDDFEELRDYFCDGQYDRAADFIYRSDENHVVIIQSKYRGASKSEIEADFDAFRRCLKKLCPSTRPPDAKINQKVLDVIADIDWENDNFSLIYLSLARKSDPIAQNAEQDLEDVPNSPLSDISERSELLYLYEDEINIEWRNVLGQNVGVAPTVQLLLSQAPHGDYFEFVGSSGIHSFVAALSAAQLHQLYTRHQHKLFNLNIRNYIGDTRTNKEIIATANTDAANFFLYNNGLSAVARRVVPRKEGGQTFLDCSDFSIINGAQTFRSISKAHSKSGSAGTRNLRVLIRVSEIDFVRKDEAEVLDKITKYNNTQNSMKLSDFRSNDNVQQSLVRYIDEVSAFGGKKYLYKNKRTQASERNRITIKMDDFCRAIFAYQFGPIDVFGGQSHLYDTRVEGGYVKLFGKDLSAVSQDEFDRLFGIWLITSRLETLLKEDKKQAAKSEDEIDLLRKSALERKFLVYFAAGEVLREVCKMRSIEETSMLRSFAKPRWQTEKNKTEFIDEVFQVSTDMVVQAYQLAQKAPGFVHRNFFRDAETVPTIKSARASRKGQLQQLAKRLTI